MSYGPKMTPKQRIKLLKEIEAFKKDPEIEKKMRRNIEDSAVGGKDIDAYANWVSANGGLEPVQANPDQLAEGDAFQWGQTSNFNLVGLSDSEREAWEMCKEMSYTRKDAAEEMGVALGTLNKLLSRAQAKLRGQL